ncbi:uncharacterized protein LOC117644054 [Thrips palmi]|uniref:Uncharacterized protein LOC117644054 n=1 Tax=Thrips palmi TaxID=161013 RepID=A0A6P8YPF5_THRPL|nr:uncharacterized protein LOC117644054 [Thrips palmi]
MFLLPLFTEMVHLKEGFPVRLHNSENETTVKVYLLFGCVDSPAKASFMNIKCHAGYCSCTKCLIVGEKSPRTDNVMVFLYEENVTRRSDANYLESVMEAVRTKKESKGVLGPSILAYMTHSSFIQSVSIDSMHALAIGVTKQLLRLWFDSKYKDKPFSLYQHAGRVNAMLTNLQLPHFVQRLPEDVTKLAFWKASLARNFLFYIAPVIMRSVMKPEYFENFLLLVNGSSLLHKSSLSDADLDLSDERLNSFCKGFEHLYGVRYMSSNIHSLLHLSETVRETGNLCLTNCFDLEGLNGQMVALVHGTLHAVQEIYQNMRVLAVMPSLIPNVKSDAVKLFYLKVTKQRKYLNITGKVGERTYVVGEMDTITKHFAKIHNLLTVLFPAPVEFRTFPRLYHGKFLFVSSTYDSGSRVSSFCAYTSPTGISHGVILTFLKTVTDPAQYFALVSKSDDLTVNIERFVKFKCEENYDLIDVSRLKCVSFGLHVQEDIFLVHCVKKPQ